MKCKLLALWLIGAILYTPTVASSQSLEAASPKAGQAEVHSVIVDMPRVISMPPASPEAWKTFWDTLPPSVPLNEQRGAPDQATQISPDPYKIELLKSPGGQDT